MITGSLITIREGLEAFLIIGILLGYLTKINQPQLKVHVWIGTGAAFLVSAMLAIARNSDSSGLRMANPKRGINWPIVACLHRLRSCTNSAHGFCLSILCVFIR